MKRLIFCLLLFSTNATGEQGIEYSMITVTSCGQLRYVLPIIKHPNGTTEGEFIIYSPKFFKIFPSKIEQIAEHSRNMPLDDSGDLDVMRVEESDWFNIDCGLNVNDNGRV